MTRIYLGVGAEQLRVLKAEGTLDGPRVVPESDDETDELDALLTAAEDGPAMLAAEVDSEESAVSLRDVESIHLMIDESGAPAWFAPSELDAVISLIE
jgi:hypothetical protein